MVTPRSSDTSTQWHSAIYATVAVSRFRKTLSLNSNGQQGLEDPEHSQFEIQPMQDDDTYSQASHSEEANQAKALDRALEDTNPEVELLKLVRDDFVKQLDAYGLVLVLLSGITFVAILQPPGSFDKGKLQKSLLVSFFMLLATLSFFIACTGLGAVMVGCAQLFRPFYETELAKIVNDSKRFSVHNSPSTGTLARFRNWLLRCSSPSHVPFDNIDVLAKLCDENVYRIRRIRIYLGVSLVLCIAAYICGALAVMVANDCQRYMLTGAMGAGGVIPIFEICITVKPELHTEGSSQPGLQPGLQPESKTRELKPKLHMEYKYLTKRYGGYPYAQTQP